MLSENNHDERINNLGIKGELSEGYDKLPKENIYSEYEMKLPDGVMKFCEYIASVGGRALVAGGSVRDMVRSKLLSNDVFNAMDIDIEVYGIKPGDLILATEMFFSSDKQKTNGKSFEVISVMDRVEKIKIDITTPRESNLTGAGQNGFFSDSRPDFTILQASLRRDLTCNSILYDPLKKLVYDPYGGVRDIGDNILRITSFDKFSEDPVRVFRLMQILARTESVIDQDSEDQCKVLFTKIKNQNVEEQHSLGDGPIKLNKDRVYKEFVKLFANGSKPSLGLEFARRIGVIDFYFPTLAKLKDTKQEYLWHKEGDVWIHTMQAVDAAAEIAIRDGLSERDTLVLVLAVLCHDLGKVTTTSITKSVVDGKEIEQITSRGHDLESVLLADELIDQLMNIGGAGNVDGFVGEENTQSSTPLSRELKGKVKTLVKNHMHLREYYRHFKDGIKTHRMMGRLARDLDISGTSIFLLAKLEEADQRARKENSQTPYSLEEVDGLSGWKTWVDSYEYIKLPTKLVDGKRIIDELHLKPGVLLGVLVDWVFDDQLAGDVDTVEEGIEKTKTYREVVLKGMKYIKENNLYKRENLKKNMSKDLDDEILVWMKNKEVKDMLVSLYL